MHLKTNAKNKMGANRKMKVQKNNGKSKREIVENKDKYA